MKMNSKRIIFRILLLASIAILMILLCGCRTRLSNNSDVHSRINDDTGYMSENYEYRRDDLGLSVAEKPLINPDNGEDDEDYDEDFDYEPTPTDPYEDDLTTDDTDDTEPDTPDKNSSTTTRPSSSTTRRTGTGIRRPSTTTTTAVKVNLNANGGTCKKKSIYVRKGSTYGTLPAAERDGYKQTGWFTKKEGGKQVTSKTKVTTSSTHTLYAQWEVQTKKTYKVTFNINTDDDVELETDSITVEEDGTYGELPKPRRVGYTFDGWFTEKDGGKEVSKGDNFTANADQTLYAHWDDDHNKWWENEFTVEANKVTDPMPYFLVRKIEGYSEYGFSDTDARKVETMLEDCKGSKETEEQYADLSILLVESEEDKFVEIAEDAIQAYLGMEGHADFKGKIIVISKDAIKNNSNENLVARIRMLNEMYGSTLDAEKASEQLGIDKSLIYVFTP